MKTRRFSIHIDWWITKQKYITIALLPNISYHVVYPEFTLTQYMLSFEFWVFGITIDMEVKDDRYKKFFPGSCGF